MNQCPSCGGILGRDCFNPRECAQISSYQERDFQTLEIQIEILKQALKDNNIPIPDLNPQPAPSSDPDPFGLFGDPDLPY